MKKKTVLTLLTTAALALGLSTPSYAGGPMGFVGAAAGFLVDVPEGIVVDSLYRCPKEMLALYGSCFRR